MEQLLAFLAQFWRSILPIYIVWYYERAVHLSCGDFKREVGPGVWLKWPFVDLVHSCNVKPGPATMRAQSLTTKDGIEVVIGVRLIWSVFDARAFLLDIEGEDAVLSEATYGVITEQVAATDWNELRTEAFRHSCHKAARARARRFGVTVDNLYFSDVAKMQSLRLITAAGLGQHQADYET